MGNDDIVEDDDARILRAVLRLGRRLRHSAAEDAVTGSGLALLASLRRHGRMTAGALARSEGLQPQSLSRLLVRLERDGLIARPTDADDRRRQAIGLTDAGMRILDRAMSRRRAWLTAAISERLDAAERQALLTAADAMLRIAGSFADEERSRSDEPRLLVAEPQIFVADMAVAQAFYVDRLGFALVFAHGDPPFYAQVRRGGVRLNLRHVEEAAFAGGFRARETDALSATVIVAGIDPLFDAFTAAGAAMHQALKREPWGARSFIVRDPDGNLVCFVEAVAG